MISCGVLLRSYFLVSTNGSTIINARCFVARILQNIHPQPMVPLAMDSVDKSQRKKAVLTAQSSVSILFSTRCISVGYEKGKSDAWPNWVKRLMSFKINWKCVCRFLIFDFRQSKFLISKKVSRIIFKFYWGWSFSHSDKWIASMRVIDHDANWLRW